MLIHIPKQLVQRTAKTDRSVMRKPSGLQGALGMVRKVCRLISTLGTSRRCVIQAQAIGEAKRGCARKEPAEELPSSRGILDDEAAWLRSLEHQQLYQLAKARPGCIDGLLWQLLVRKQLRSVVGDAEELLDGWSAQTGSLSRLHV